MNMALQYIYMLCWIGSWILGIVLEVMFVWYMWDILGFGGVLLAIFLAPVGLLFPLFYWMGADVWPIAYIYVEAGFLACVIIMSVINSRNPS